MYHSTRAVLCLATAAAAAIAILPLTAAPVSAAQLTLNDARGDMWFIEEGSTEPDPAPTARVGDFVRATFRHTDRRVEVRSKFVELRRTGLMTRMVEQNAAEALAIADRAYVLRLGEVAASGPAAEIRAATDLKALYLGG